MFTVDAVSPFRYLFLCGIRQKHYFRRDEGIFVVGLNQIVLQ